MDQCENIRLQCVTNKVTELKNRWCHTFPSLILFLISPARLPTVTLNPCDDSASISTCEWQPFFQPEHKCVSITPVYRLLTVAERGESTPTTFILVRIWNSLGSSLKNTCAHKQTEIQSSLLMLIYALWSERSSSTNVRGGKRTDGGHMPRPWLLLHHVSIFWHARACFGNISVSAPLVLPDIPWVCFCVAAPQDILLRALFLVSLSDAVSAVKWWSYVLLTFIFITRLVLPPAFVNALPFKCQRASAGCRWTTKQKQHNTFVTLWSLGLTGWDNRRQGPTRLTQSQSVYTDFLQLLPLTFPHGEGFFFFLTRFIRTRFALHRLSILTRDKCFFHSCMCIS